MPRRSTALAFAEPDSELMADLAPEREKLAGILAQCRDVDAKIAEEQAARAEARQREGDAWTVVCEAAGDEFYARSVEENIPSWTMSEAQANLISARRNAPPLPLDEAKERHADAQREHARIETEIEWRATKIRELEGSRPHLQRDVASAANRALTADPGFAALIQEARRRAHAFHDVEATIAMLHQHGVPSSATEGWDRRRPRDPSNYPLLTQWAEALGRLKTDASTPLPMIDARA